MHDGKHLNTYAFEEHDNETYRKRIATYVDGNSVSYEDASFSSADSPAVLNVFNDLNRIGTKGYIKNSGPGALLAEFSHDGSVYGGVHTIEDGETLTLGDLKMRKIRLTYVSPTAYRVMVA